MFENGGAFIDKIVVVAALVDSSVAICMLKVRFQVSGNICLSKLWRLVKFGTVSVVRG